MGPPGSGGPVLLNRRSRPPNHLVREAERHRHGAPDFRTELPSPRNGWVLLNRACPLEDSEPTPVTVGDVDEVGIRVLENLPGLPVNISEGCIFRGQVVSNLPRQKRIGDIPHSKALIVPGLVKEARRAVVEPRIVDRLLTALMLRIETSIPRASQALELPFVEVKHVADVRNAIAGNDLEVCISKPFLDVRALEIGHIDDPPDTRWTVKTLVREDHQIGMLVRVYDDGLRAMSCPHRTTIKGRNIVQLANEPRL